ncbi:MAG TPA: hypothetical protein VFN53_06390 [Acidobacteriaceae bacterium]|nr:hypothetical protein [Acidobacteriaceae bacterium]
MNNPNCKMLHRYVLSALDANGVPIAKDYSYKCQVPLMTASGPVLCSCMLDMNQLQALRKDSRVTELGSMHENNIIPAALVDVYPAAGILATDTLHRALRKLTKLHVDFEFDE